MTKENEISGEICRYCEPTERPWRDGCNCRRVYCRNEKRAAKWDDRTDGARFHSFVVGDDTFVRSVYCCRAHCVDFEESK